MSETTPAYFADLWSADREAQNRAFSTMMEATDRPVPWAYAVWDDVVANLHHKDNHNRAIAAQLLCNLAKSDPANRMQTDFPALLAVTKDERFVTARHCLQALWRVGAAGEIQKALVVDGLDGRYRECATEKNCTLIRYDIIQCLRNLYDEVKDEAIRERALALIELEPDPKYRKKYAGVWKAR